VNFEVDAGQILSYQAVNTGVTAIFVNNVGTLVIIHNS
jgi:hypothetical protein